MTERYKVTRTWFVYADDPLEAIALSTYGGVPAWGLDVSLHEKDTDPPTRLSVTTRRPDDYELVDYGTNTRWVIRDGVWTLLDLDDPFGRWLRKELPRLAGLDRTPEERLAAREEFIGRVQSASGHEHPSGILVCTEGCPRWRHNDVRE